MKQIRKKNKRIIILTLTQRPLTTSWNQCPVQIILTSSRPHPGVLFNLHPDPRPPHGGCLISCLCVRLHFFKTFFSFCQSPTGIVTCQDYLTQTDVCIYYTSSNSISKKGIGVRM